MLRNVLLVGAALLIGWLALGRGGGELDGAGARKLVAEGAVLLDVRTPAEFAAGHLDGALNVPVDELPRRLDEVGPRDKPVVIYCRSGRRSATAASLMRQSGFASVHDLGGMSRW
jgi:phage shock protein E